MTHSAVQQVLKKVARWPVEWQLELAQALDRMTAQQRWDLAGSKARERARQAPLGESEIHAAVTEVRKEQPLHG